MTGHRAREGHRLRVREVIGSQRDIFGTFDVEWQCEGVQPVRSPPRGSERCAENPLNVSVTFKADCLRPRSHSSAVLGRDRSSGCPDSRRRP